MGPAEGTAAPALLGDWRCSPGRAGVRPAAAPASARISGSQPKVAPPGRWLPGWVLGVTPLARSENGRFQAAAPASWAQHRAGNRSAASAPLTQASPLCVGASPVLVGKPRHRWLALGRPEGIWRGAARPPPRHHQALWQLAAYCEEVPRLPLPVPVRGKSRCDCREAECRATSQAVDSLVPCF